MSDNIEEYPWSKLEKHENKRQELIDRFQRGGERYFNSPLFRSVIDSMSHGQDPYKVIDILLDHIDEQQEQINRMVGVPRKYMVRDERDSY